MKLDQFWDLASIGIRPVLGFGQFWGWASFRVGPVLGWASFGVGPVLGWASFGVGPVLGLGQFWLGQFWVRPVLGLASFYRPVMGRPVMSGPVLGCNQCYTFSFSFFSKYVEINSNFGFLSLHVSIILQQPQTGLISRFYRTSRKSA